MRKATTKLLSLVLAFVTAMGLAIPALAASATIQSSNSTHVTIGMAERYYFLRDTSGTNIGGSFWQYTANKENVTGSAYCVSHGLKAVPTNKLLPIGPRYGSSPKTMGAFACGYPQVPLADFISDNNLPGLTEAEFGYATQLAIWASLGQLGVEGTAFTAGSQQLKNPAATGDSQQIRVFIAIQAILAGANKWTQCQWRGMYFRYQENQEGNTLALQSPDGLAGLAESSGKVKQETISGKDYYTVVFYVASATPTKPNGNTIDVWPDSGPSGTILMTLDNKPLPTRTLNIPEKSINNQLVYRVPTTGPNTTSLNGNGVEYMGAFKLAIPADNAAKAGEVYMRSNATVTQYEIFIATNTDKTEQSYIIADPSVGNVGNWAKFIWSAEEIELGRLIVTKTDGTGSSLTGATFELRGNNGFSATKAVNGEGVAVFESLDPAIQYTLYETAAPEGYTPMEPRAVRISSSVTTYETIRNDSEAKLRVKKIDKQHGRVLQGAVFEFRQIDGSFVTTGTTGFDGYIEFGVKELPFGSYTVAEKNAPEGYLKDTAVQTVNWTGKADTTLTFTNVRIPRIILIKTDEYGNPLGEAVFRVYKDGKLIDTVATSPESGIATIMAGLGEGYIQVEEITAPMGYALDSTRHGIHFDPYNPATESDPVLIVTNKAKPSLRVLKYDQASGKPLPGVTFEVYHNAKLFGVYTTDSDGEILLANVSPGTYLVKEVSEVSTHVANSTPQQIQIDAGGGVAQLVFFNQLKPGIRLVKVDSSDIKPLAGAVFVVTKVGGSFTREFITGTDGEIDLTSLEPGAYQIREKKAPDGYLTDDSIRTVQVNPDENAVFVFTNTRKPALIVWKYDEQTAKTLPNAEFSVSQKGGPVIYEGITNGQGFIRLDDLDEGWVTVTEMAPPPGYLLSNPVSRDVYLEAGKVVEIKFDNLKCPTLRIEKRDSVTGDPIPNVKFSVQFSPAVNFTGGVVDLGTFMTDTAGCIALDNDLQSGRYRVAEIEPAPGYTMKGPVTQDIFLKGGDSKTVYFENIPKSALVIRKIDSATGLPVAGATFEVRYLAGSSGSGGTLIKTAVTSVNGTIVLTSLNPGTYVVQEIKAATGYQISNPSTQTAYISGKEQDVVELIFTNPKMGRLVITKLDSMTRQPIAGVTFLVADSSGAVIGPNNGEYTTDPSGVIEITEYLPIGSTVNVKEIRVPDSHIMDAPPQSIKIMENTTHRLTFYNSPKSGLQIKKIDSVTRQPIGNVEFSIAKMNGERIGNYRTDKSGLIYVPLSPGWYVVSEVKAPDGYILNAAPRNVEIKTGEPVVLEIENIPMSGLTIIKTDANTGKTLKGVVFDVRRADGQLVSGNVLDGNQPGTANNSPDRTTSPNGSVAGSYTTDANGRIQINGLAAGEYHVVERKPLPGYELDTEVYSVTVTPGKTATLQLANKPLGGIRLVKIDSITKKGIYNVEFMVFDQYNKVVGTFYTDNNGVIDFAGILPEGRYSIRETRPAANYYNDDIPRTVEFKAGQVTEIRWENVPKMGQIQILKKSGDDNQINGVTKGTPLTGAIFEVYEYKSGNMVDRMVSGKDGRAVSKPLPLGRYLVKEVQAPQWYKLSTRTLDIDVEFATQIVRMEFLNYSANTGVYIKKTGPSECMPGDTIRYDIKAVQNTSTVPLTDFYWRDALPVSAVRLTKIVTGTYNQALQYKIMVTTNKGNTRLIADNLSTTRNNVIDCSNASLGLKSDEYVTSFSLLFGTVKAGFAQVIQPQVFVKVLSTLPNGYEFANKADVGGKYGKEWIISNSTTRCKIFRKAVPLPRTGF